MSSYEMKIMSILKASNIYFECEKTFDTLQHGKLRFDFYCPKHNILIEIQGEQHYQQIKKFHPTRVDFKKAQERDRRKISWCLANRITLYCIPYWEIKQINTVFDILNPEFIAHNKWHNDDAWRNFYIKNKS